MKKLYILLLGILILSLVACGGDQEEDKPPATSAPESTAVESAPEPTAEPPQASSEDTSADTSADTSTDEPAADETEESSGLNLAALQTNPEALGGGPLDSYRLRATWRVEPKGEEDASVESLEMEVAYTRDPQAQEISMGDAAGGFATNMIQIGDRMWIQTGEQWIEVSSEETAQFDQMLTSFDAVTAGLSGDAKLVGEEELNGVATRHYTFDESILGLGMGVYESLKGDVWVAIEGDYAVKYLFDAEDKESIVHWEWEVYDINAPFTIEPPAEAEGARDDIPVMPDATERTAFGAMVSYETPSDMATVADFYREQMPAQGWAFEEGSSTITDQFTMLNFVKEGERSSIMLSPGDGGGTAVVIQVSE